jgi:molecular chaperone Hsp33
MSLPDFLQRFLFPDHDIRGVRVHLNESFKTILEKHSYPGLVRQLIGEAAAATALLSSTLKFKGQLSLQARGSEPVSLLMAECSNKQDVRATAQFNIAFLSELERPESKLRELIGQAQLCITIQPDEGSRYQGIVPIENDHLSECLEDYFARSEQLDTLIMLNVHDDHASGLLLQKLPQNEQHIDDDLWNKLCVLSKTLKPEEMHHLDTKTLIKRLFHEENVQLFEPEPLQFNCSCSAERSAQAIQTLGEEEALEIVDEQGQIDIDCHFCGQHYRFDKEQVKSLFGKNRIH